MARLYKYQREEILHIASKKIQLKIDEEESNIRKSYIPSKEYKETKSKFNNFNKSLINFNEFIQNSTKATFNSYTSRIASLTNNNSSERTLNINILLKSIKDSDLTEKLSKMQKYDFCLLRSLIMIANINSDTNIDQFLDQTIEKCKIVK